MSTQTPDLNTIPIREGASEQAPERTLRTVWKEGRWYVEQVETLRRVLGRDIYTIIRRTYMRVNEGGDWRERKRGKTIYVVITEMYDTEEGFRINIEEIPKEMYTKVIKELKREVG